MGRLVGRLVGLAVASQWAVVERSDGEDERGARWLWAHPAGELLDGVGQGGAQGLDQDRRSPSALGTAQAVPLLQFGVGRLWPNRALAQEAQEAQEAPGMPGAQVRRCAAVRSRSPPSAGRTRVRAWAWPQQAALPGQAPHTRGRPR